MAWRLAKALETLRTEVNVVAPFRGKQSDGTVGNLEHANRKSDHNPNSKGVVRALDLTHDPAGGFDSYIFAEWIVGLRDPRVDYVISNGRIASGSKGWTWRAYTGANRHSHHVHVSAATTSNLYDDTSPWHVVGMTGSPATGPSVEVHPVLSEGAKGKAVERLQALLGVQVDGWFGPKTKRAVVAFQRAHKLHPDAIVGPYTWDQLEKHK
jgi:peptidoglycan hydrolase-like protein with peptidoglycan-binding domain